GRLRASVKGNRSWRQVWSKGCNRTANSCARRDARDRRTLTTREAVICALDNPIYLLQRRYIRLLAKFSGSHVSGEELAAYWIEPHPERIAESRRNHID